MIYPSQLLEDAVASFARLPGIGRKTALRLALHLLRAPEQDSLFLADSVARLRQHAVFCRQCGNLADDTLCGICANPSRDAATVCIVQDLRDVLAIEATNHYRGTYHILGGLIAPMDGVGPEQLHLAPLMERAEAGAIKEAILALAANMEGETTAFYLGKRLKPFGIRTTTLARGIAVGGELEYADELTLARSLSSRQPLDANHVD